MSGGSIGKSMGFCGHWGLSSGFDVVKGLDLSQLDNSDSNEPINILLLQPGDIRHVLTTIARRRRYRKNKNDPLRPIHFYLYETPIEILARDLLLLEVFNDYKVPIRQRANIFLEIFGNNKTQRRTSLYIEELAKRLILLLTKGVGLLHDVIDCSVLRYREKDLLEAAFKMYFKSVVFNMDSLFDHRQRGLYEDRFDARKALYDWDYHTSFKKKGSIVHIKQYKEWRHSGIAYEFGDQSYTEPNKTLMSYTEGTMKQGKDKGHKKEIMGFWGDIVCSPYVAFGVDCEVPNKHAEGLFEILNKNSGTEQHRHHAVEVSLYNMFSLLWETETGQVYKMSKKNDIYSGLGAEASFLSNTLDGEEAASSTTNNNNSSSDAPADPEAAEVKQQQPSTEESDKDKSGLSTIKEEEEAAETETETEEIKVDTSLSVGVAPTSSSSTVEDLKKKRERELVKAIVRAETIEESYKGVKVFPMSGSLSGSLDKPKYQNFFDVIFVSSRGAQLLSEKFLSTALKPSVPAVVDSSGSCSSSSSSSRGGYAAIETGKFVVPLNQELVEELNKKETELATALGWTKCCTPLVERRHRDELDREDDVMFFQRVL